MAPARAPGSGGSPAPQASGPLPAEGGRCLGAGGRARSALTAAIAALPEHNDSGALRAGERVRESQGLRGPQPPGVRREAARGCGEQGGGRLRGRGSETGTARVRPRGKRLAGLRQVQHTLPFLPPPFWGDLVWEKPLLKNSEELVSLMSVTLPTLCRS